MVDGGVSPRAQNSLRRLFKWKTVSSSRIADSVCGLCFLAEGLAEGEGAGKPGFLLEAGIGRCPVRFAVAHGQAASGNTKLSWRYGDFPAFRKAAGAHKNSG